MAIVRQGGGVCQQGGVRVGELPTRRDCSSQLLLVVEVIAAIGGPIDVSLQLGGQCQLEAAVSRGGAEALAEVVSISTVRISRRAIALEEAKLFQLGTKLFAKNAVDDKVDGRVEADENVREDGYCLEQWGAHVKIRLHAVHEKRRCVTSNEDGDNEDEHGG